MKKYFQKYKWLMVRSFIIFIVIIPIIIHWMFKCHAPYAFLIVEWTAGDVLSFYGAILASVATIIGVYLSVEYAQKNYREDEVNRVRPYLALTHYNSKSKVNLFSEVFDYKVEESTRTSDEFYEEYRMNKVYIVIESDDIKFMEGLTEKQQQELKQSGLEWKAVGEGRRSLCRINLFSMPFEIENVGNGAALNTMIGFYKKGEGRCGKNIFTLKKGESTYCHIFSDCQESTIYGEYILELVYWDILENSYSQKYTVEFGNDAQNGKFFKSIDLLGKQEIIK